VAAVGRELFDLFFAGYTRKQWGRPAAALSASVTARIPFRTNDDDRYFTDRFQGIPTHGYTALFERMLNHPNITTRVGTEFVPGATDVSYEHLVYTGPIDAYFAYRFGGLPYRSLRFEYEHLAGRERYQPVGQVNFPGMDQPFTRIVEYKHLTAQAHSGTTIVREFATDAGEPYYPVPAPENQLRYERYATLAEAEGDVTFVGRLAQYKYYNMDQVVGAALTAAQRLIGGARSVSAAVAA
jgi:UDP-galactopyranose mutase